MDIIEKRVYPGGPMQRLPGWNFKIAQRRWYRYDTGLDGGLVISPEEAAIVRWISGCKVQNNGFMDRYLNSDSHEAIILDEIFKAVQQEKARGTNCPEETVFAPIFF